MLRHTVLVGDETKTDAPNRLDEARSCRVVAELAAQGADVDIKRLRRAEPVDVPDASHEVLASNDNPRVRSELDEQVELLSGEIQARALEDRESGGDVDLQIAELDRLSGGALGSTGATQDGTDARDDLARAERLDDVVVGSQLQAENPVHLGAAGGEHDDRHLGAPAQLATDVAAVAVGQGEVEQDEVGLDPLGFSQRLRRGGRDDRLEAVALQRERKRLIDRALVFDEKDRSGCAHGLNLAAELAPRSLAAKALPSLYLGLSGDLPGAADTRGESIRRLSTGDEKERDLKMSNVRTKIAVGATVLGLGGLAGFAMSAEPKSEPETLSAKNAKPEVVRRTIRRTRRVEPDVRSQAPVGTAPAPAPTAAASAPQAVPASALAPAAAVSVGSDDFDGEDDFEGDDDEFEAREDDFGDEGEDDLNDDFEDGDQSGFSGDSSGDDGDSGDDD